MLSVPKFFIFIYSIATLGYTQKVDLSTHKDLILKLHNGYRGLQGASNMKKLRWSSSLAKEAEKWVGRCWYQFLAGNHGENMFYSESALPNNVLIERAIDTWYTEKYGWRRSGDCTDACSYTQVVWAKTDEVGCAAQRCPKLNLAEEFVNNGWFITCLYNPKGNALGQMPFESGNPCTLCDIGERCTDKLCVKNIPQAVKVSVRNRRPPRPKVKPILTFDDVQKRVPRQAFRNWWNRGPVTPSFQDQYRQNHNRFMETVQEVVTLKPKDQVPTTQESINTDKLIMHESAFGLETIKKKESKNKNKIKIVQPQKKESPVDDNNKKQNGSNDFSTKDISPVYAQMTMNGPVFSFKSTLFKSHLNEIQENEKTTRKVETTTTTTATTTATTTTPMPSTMKVPRWFALRISQQDDPINQQLPRSNEKRWEQYQKSIGKDSNGNGKPSEQKSQTIDDAPVQKRKEHFQRNQRNRNSLSSTKTKFVFKTAETKRQEEIRAREMTELQRSTGTTVFPDTTERSSQNKNFFNGPGTDVPTPPPNQLMCPDSDSNCKHWSKYCNTNDYVKTNCPGTCNTCPTPPPDLPCPDLDPNCHLWQSYCMQNDYVRDHCFNTCNNCTNAVHVTPPPNGTGQFPVTSQVSSAPTSAPCIDSDQYCPGWKNLCHTDKYVQYHCKKSCSYCN